MIPPEKVELLQQLLGALPKDVANRLAMAIEVDRLADGTALPHGLILDGLRPVLRNSGHTRTLTPLRMFCRPFEDILVVRPDKNKQTGRIARESIRPVWTWLARTLLPEETKAYCREVRAAVLGHHPDVALRAAMEYWDAASAAIATALGDEAARKAARGELGGKHVAEDAQEIGWLLGAGAEVLEIQAALCKPVLALPDPLLFRLREIYNRVLEKTPEAGPYIAVIAMSRMERPWEALKLPLFVSRQTGDTLISSTDMGLVGELIFADIDAHLATIRAQRQPQFDAGAMVHAVSRFAELSMGMVKEVEIRRNGQWGQRLMKVRTSAAEVMEKFMQRAPREIMAALPMHRAGYKGGPRLPDLAHAPDAEKQARALAYANLIVGTRPYAAAASFASSLTAAVEEVQTEFDTYIDEILHELRHGKGENHANAVANFEFVATLTSLLFSAEEGELLRRRGRSATAARAAA